MIFAANSFDLFAQDDWRILPKLSLNLGFRYEYNGPFTEAHDRIANLDVANGFTGASVVLPRPIGSSRIARCIPIATISRRASASRGAR